MTVCATRLPSRPNSRRYRLKAADTEYPEISLPPGYIPNGCVCLLVYSAMEKYSIYGKPCTVAPQADYPTYCSSTRALGISVEYLVTGETGAQAPTVDTRKLYKYAPLLDKIDSLPERQKDIMRAIVAEFTAD